MKKFGRETPYIVLLLIVVFASFICSVFFVQLLLIQGESMEPTYHSGQLVLTSKLDKDYERGDCVLFYCEELKTSLVKRIAALPGDCVQIKDGTLYIDSSPVLPYPGAGEIEDAGLAEETLIIPEGHYFVLGDNFSRSKDSRHSEVGFVARENIRGKIIQH